jgi:hypothetical protein
MPDKFVSKSIFKIFRNRFSNLLKTDVQTSYEKWCRMLMQSTSLFSMSSSIARPLRQKIFHKWIEEHICHIVIKSKYKFIFPLTLNVNTSITNIYCSSQLCYSFYTVIYTHHKYSILLCVIRKFIVVQFLLLCTSVIYSHQR